MLVAEVVGLLVLPRYTLAQSLVLKRGLGVMNTLGREAVGLGGEEGGRK